MLAQEVVVRLETIAEVCVLLYLRYRCIFVQYYYRGGFAAAG